MSAKRKPDEPEPESEEVYVLKTEISSVETKTKSVRLEIPDFMERINEMEDDGDGVGLPSNGKLNVDGNDFDFGIFWRPYESIIRVYVENMNHFDSTVSIKLAGVEKSVELEGFEDKLDFSLENCMTWAEENGNVLNLDVKITQKPGQKTVWKR